MMGSVLFVVIMLMLGISACVGIGFYYGAKRTRYQANIENRFDTLHRFLNDLREDAHRALEEKVRENDERFTFADRTYSDTFEDLRRLIGDKTTELETRITDVETSLNKALEDVETRQERQSDDAFRDMLDRFNQVYQEIQALQQKPSVKKGQ